VADLAATTYVFFIFVFSRLGTAELILIRKFFNQKVGPAIREDTVHPGVPGMGKAGHRHQPAEGAMEHPHGHADQHVHRVGAPTVRDQVPQLRVGHRIDGVDEPVVHPDLGGRESCFVNFHLEVSGMTVASNGVGFG
jgi:hypothetical protein